MKIAVIVSDANAAAHVGGEVERIFRTFDAPPDLAAYVAASMGRNFVNVSLAIEDAALAAQAEQATALHGSDVATDADNEAVSKLASLYLALERAERKGYLPDALEDAWLQAPDFDSLGVSVKDAAK